MNRHHPLFVACVILLILFPLPAAVHSAGAIKVAAIFAKTGEAATPNAMYFNGVRFAVNEINRQGGLLGRPVELIEIDNRSTALGSKAAAEQAAREGVTAVIGGPRSSYAMAMAPVLQAARIPMISPTATIPELTLLGDYIFRACFIDDFQGRTMAGFAVRDLGAKTAVVLTNTGNQYSLTLAAVFIKHYEEAGGKLLLEGEYLEDVTDFQNLLAKANRLHPDVVFIPGYGKDTGLIMKTAKEMGITFQYLGGDGWGEELFYQYAGDAADGSYACSNWNKNNPDPLNRSFVAAFEKTYGRIISFSVPLAYDSCMLLADAVKRADSGEPRRIRDALAATRGFQGLTGDITFDGNRNPIGKSAVILKYENGAVVYVKSFRP
ncbi:MAG: ABC transporter substrate-binding protein [Thermodesulfobacteriota bacterium]